MLREMGPDPAYARMPAACAPESRRDSYDLRKDEADEPSERPRGLLRRLARVLDSAGHDVPAAPPPPSGVAALAARIDWAAAPQRLLVGDLTGLDHGLADAIRRIAAEPLVIQRARGYDPVRFAVALLAASAARRHRAADRLWYAIIGSQPVDDVIAEVDRLMRAW